MKPKREGGHVTGQALFKPGIFCFDPYPSKSSAIDQSYITTPNFVPWSLRNRSISAMGSAASKAPKGARRYPPSPSTLVNHPSSTPTQISNSFPAPAERPQYSEDVQAKLSGTTYVELSNYRNTFRLRSETCSSPKPTGTSHRS